MLFAAFRSLGQQLLVISGILGACTLIVWIWSGQQAAGDLVGTAVTGMKGPWVWTFGFGLASFVRRRGRILPADVNGVLVTNETTAALVARIDRSTRHRYALPYTIPVVFLGVFLTTVYGIPNTGIAYGMIFVGVCAIYYIAGFLLFHFVETTLAFHQLGKSMDAVEFKRIYSPLHLENLTSYLAMSTTIGVLAIYAGFRGTLTAGFQFQQEVLTSPHW